MAFISSTVTSVPASKRLCSAAMLTGWVCVRKGSNGIDFFMCGPRSFRMRMWIGICPPSKRARRLEPERAPAPFWPRPEVLPVPEPSPRPTRLRGRRLPGAGARLCSPMRSCSWVLCLWRSLALLDLDQVAHRVQHAARLL